MSSLVPRLSLKSRRETQAHGPVLLFTSRAQLPPLFFQSLELSEEQMRPQTSSVHQKGL